MKKFIKIIIGSIFICIVYIFTAPLALWVIGYYPDGVGWKVAQEIVRNKGNVSDCKKIIHTISHPFSPTAGEQRSSCIYDYAKLTKDPSACELLMPSSYGWDCLGAAEEANARICWFDFGKNTQKIGNTILPECGGRTDSVASRCCNMAKFVYIEKGLDCDRYSDSVPLHDQCLELVARREKNIDLCTGIHNKNVLSACRVAVSSLLTGQL